MKHYYFLFFFVLLLCSCSFSNNQQNNKIILAGSTSVAPFIEILAEDFMQKHPEIIINVQGGGSTAGIVAATEGAADMGMSSRALEEKEMQQLNTTTIAWDGIAIIVNPKNPINTLTTNDILSIFNGTITNWHRGKNTKITVITREEGSGTRGAFQSLIMNKQRITPYALVQDSNGAVREMVTNDINAIGFISAGLVNNNVKAIRVDDIPPTYDNILSKNYRLIRPFLLVYKSKLNRQEQEFMDFILSEEGQSILKKEGLATVSGGSSAP